MPNIKTNFAYNIALTLSTYVINLVLFPYVSRVLGVDLVGKIGFTNNVINYFSLFALWGVAIVGIREIASCGEDREKRSKVFSSILAFIMILTSIITITYFVAINTIPRFIANKELMVYGTFSLFFTTLLIEWFYQGMENFKYITIRSVLVKLLYALSVLFFIRTENDYVLYYKLTVGVVVINALINLIHSRKFVRFSLGSISLKQYAKPIFSLGVYMILTSMYTTFNVIFLGFVCTETEVGYYYTSQKIYAILLGLLSAFTSVMLPRMSSLLAKNDKAEFQRKIEKSFDMIVSVATPLVICGVILAPQIIRVISGVGYEGAIRPMQLIMPLILVIGIAQVCVKQVLIPMKKDTVILKVSAVGACIGVMLNFFIVKNYGAVGTAMVLLASELCINSFLIYYVISCHLAIFPIRKVFVNVIGGIPYMVICILTTSFNLNPVFTLVFSFIVCFIYFILFKCFVERDSVVGGFIMGKIIVKKRKD